MKYIFILFYIYSILVYMISLYHIILDDNPVYYLWNERLYTCLLYRERDLHIQIHTRGVYTRTLMRTNSSFVCIGFAYRVAACFGRVFLQVHHILDVVIGALFGITCGLLLHWQDWTLSLSLALSVLTFVFSHLKTSVKTWPILTCIQILPRWGALRFVWDIQVHRGRLS